MTTNYSFTSDPNTGDTSLDGNDSDYEDLPPITGDVDDFTDGTMISNVSIQRIPYTRLFDPPKSFNDPKNNWLLPHCSVKVKITHVDHNTTTHLLNPNLYTIEVQHSSYKWTVKRRHNHFNHLHQQLLIFRASLTIPLPMKKHKLRRKSFGPANRRPVPRFPRRPEALISQEGLETRKQQLEDYLQNCLKIPMYRSHHEMMNFLEISPLSFVDELGHKGKEFLVKKRAGGFRRATCCTRVENFFTDISGHWRKRWLVVKDTCILYLRPKDGRIRAVMLFDHGFNADSGVSHVGVHQGIRISNMSRDLYLKCWTSRKASELADYLMEISRTLARDFTQSNRYESYAPIRSQTSAQWFIDGANHFEAVSEALEAAKQEIFITDWWLSPEIYMRRPVIHGDQWRLDQILKRKAIQGVRVFILLYKEVELGISINSVYTKQTLIKLHPNIQVLRHPDTARGGPLLWSHHEKLVVIDQSYAFVGGIDLCYGRWDNYEHKLSDLGGIAFDYTDGSNNRRSICNSTSPYGMKGRSKSQPQLISSEESEKLRESKFYLPSNETVVKFDLKVEEFKNEESDIAPDLNTPNINNNISNGNLLTVDIPKITETILTDTSAGVKSTNTENSFKLRLTSKLRNKRLQAVARLQSLKHLTRKRHDSDSISEDNLDAAIGVRKSASEEMVQGLKGGSKLWFGKDYTNFIVKDFVDLDLPFQDFIDRNTTPRMPWHDLSCMVTGAAARDVARHFIERWNFTKSQKAKFHDSYPWLIPKSYEYVNLIRPPKFLLRSNPVSCQVVRSGADWSIGIKRCETSILDAYIDIINNSKHYIYIENQFFITQSKPQPTNQTEGVINTIGEALYHRIIRAFRDQETFRVFVIFPLLPAFEGEIGTSRGVAIQAITHYNYATICRGNNSLLARLQREIGDTSRYITFYGLRNYTQLHGKLVTELVYVHSKLLLVDDNKVIIGSSNINDRSMLGYRDSEVAVVLSDEEFEPSLMNGKPYKSGKFCGSLRRMIMREHLGQFAFKSNVDVRDPICDKFYKDVWIATAAKNSSIYEKVFAVVPTDQVRSFSQLKEYLNKDKLANIDENEAKNCLAKIRGHLVLTPLFFLCDEDLTPSWGTQEKLMPQTLWT